MAGNIYDRFRRITTNQLYFPEIDGIRFLAITLVVLFHIHGYFMRKAGALYNAGSPDYDILNKFLTNSDRGVQLFFVLSGFILCLPFAHHYINNGKEVSLKQYYLRRVTRLEPPYFIAMTGIFLLQLLSHVHPASILVPSWLASLAYVHNVTFHHAPLITVVAWSLEVEIQFYILAPLFFRVLALRPLPRRLIMAFSALIIVCCQRLYMPHFASIYTCGQFFFIGILLADLYVSDSLRSLLNNKWIPLLTLACFIAMIYLPVKNKRLEANTLLIPRLILPFVIGIFCITILRNDKLKKIFSFRFIPIIGGMCYSIYLLHYTIISALGRIAIKFHLTSYYLPNILLQIVLHCAAILALSSIYYYYIERPFMSRKWLDMLLKKDKRSSNTNSVT